MSSKPKFSTTKADQHNCTFTVLHYAGKVAYSADKIVEKNLDAMPHGVLALLERSSNIVLQASAAAEVQYI